MWTNPAENLLIWGFDWFSPILPWTWFKGLAPSLILDHADFLLSKYNELKRYEMILLSSTTLKSCPKSTIASILEVAGEGEKSEPSPFSVVLWCLFTAPCKTIPLNRWLFKYEEELKNIFLSNGSYTDLLHISWTGTVTQCLWCTCTYIRLL